MKIEELTRSQSEVIDLIKSDEGSEVFMRYVLHIENCVNIIKHVEEMDREGDTENATLIMQHCAQMLYRMGKFFMKDIEFMREMIEKGDKYEEACKKWISLKK